MCSCLECRDLRNEIERLTLLKDAAISLLQGGTGDRRISYGWNAPLNTMGYWIYQDRDHLCHQAVWAGRTIEDALLLIASRNTNTNRET
mgnify:CR=1 FL=1